MSQDFTKKTIGFNPFNPTIAYTYTGKDSKAVNPEGEIDTIVVRGGKVVAVASYDIPMDITPALEPLKFFSEHGDKLRVSEELLAAAFPKFQGLSLQIQGLKADVCFNELERTKGIDPSYREFLQEQISRGYIKTVEDLRLIIAQERTAGGVEIALDGMSGDGVNMRGEKADASGLKGDPQTQGQDASSVSSPEAKRARGQ